MNWTDPINVNGKTYAFKNIDDDPLYFVMVLGNYEIYRQIICDEPIERWSLRHRYKQTVNGVSSMEWFNHGNVYYGKEIKSPDFLSQLLEHILKIIES